MKYIIDKKELKEFINDNYYPYMGIDSYQFDDFLKSKSPVTEIASGEINVACSSFNGKCYVTINKKSIEHLINKYLNNNIKIYAEEIK